VVDTYFKQYFWTFHLMVLAGAAFLVARTVNAYVGSALAPPAEAIANQAQSSTRPDRPTDVKAIPLQAFLDRNIFHAAREDLTAEAEAKKQAEAEQAAGAAFNSNACEKSQMKAALLATVVAKTEDDSIAVFSDDAKKEPVAHRVGDKLLDEAELMGIEWRRVTIKRGGRCEYFTLEEEDTTKPSAPVAAAPNPGDGEAPGDLDIGKNIKKVSASEYEIPKQEIEGVLGNLNTIATQARIVPSFNNGKANGFKLFSIRPGSLYSKIGIENGDVVQRINGYEMNSPDKALEIYSKLKDAQSISVDLIRNGKTQTLSYQIR
jgi:general secretion pathway protein C